MFAVIKTGGKQYRVAKDDVIIVEKLAGDTGAAVELDQGLMLDDGKGLTVGTPLIDGARVSATVVDQSRDKKIIVFKKKRRKNYRRTRGHRQDITVLRITDILGKGAKASSAKARSTAKSDAPATETTTAEPAAEAEKPAPKPKAAAKPKAEAKPKAAAKPKAEAKPKAAAKPKAEAKPKAAAKPKAKAKPKAESGKSEEKS